MELSAEGGRAKNKRSNAIERNFEENDVKDRVEWVLSTKVTDPE